MQEKIKRWKKLMIENDIDGIVVWSLSRLGRRMKGILSHVAAVHVV